MDIQWYPGHMVKAKKMVKENLKLVDIIIEIVDARVPMSSRNPDIEEITGNKPRIVVLNKADLADRFHTDLWIKKFEKGGIPAVAVNAITGEGINLLLKKIPHLVKDKMTALTQKGRRPRAIRAVILGIPNVGKSSLINKLAGRGAARTGDKPGVTRGKQWIKVGRELELLDTPGILWPKFDDPETGFKLAITGAIKEEIMDLENLGLKIVELLLSIDPRGLMDRYKLTELKKNPLEVYEDIGRKRGCLLPGGRIDYLQVAKILLNEFRSGKIGKYSLDKLE